MIIPLRETYPTEDELAYAYAEARQVGRDGVVVPPSVFLARLARKERVRAMLRRMV